MNTLLLRTLELKKSPSVQTFAQYREAESQNCRNSSVTSEGELLEHQTLELRVHPPNVSGRARAAVGRVDGGRPRSTSSMVALAVRASLTIATKQAEPTGAAGSSSSPAAPAKCLTTATASLLPLDSPLTGHGGQRVLRRPHHHHRRQRQPAGHAGGGGAVPHRAGAEREEGSHQQRRRVSAASGSVA